MKSLFIINDFPPILGGQSNYYFNLCSAFAKGDLIILAPKCKGYEAFDRTHNLSIVRRDYLISIPVLEKVCKIVLPLMYSLPIILKAKIDCVHCGHVLSTGIIGLLIKKILKIPYVVYTHSADILEFQKYWPIKKLLQCILNNATRVACNSQFTFNKLLDLGVVAKKIQLIYPKTNFLKFDANIETESILRRHDLQGKTIILSINRLIERKGNDVMIQAMPIILQSIPDAVYVIGGQGYYEDRLRKMVKEFGVENKVIFINRLNDEDVIKFYKVCDVFVMISRTLKAEDTEGFGAVFLEANACGKPVIGGRSGGIPEAVADGQTGLLVDPLNVQATASAVICLCQDKAYAKQMGLQGKQRVQEQFDARLYVKDVDVLMNGII